MSATGEREGVLRVVAVDDDAHLLSAFRRLLATRGFEVETFTDPHQALATIGERHYQVDLVLLDVNMPVMSGLEVLARVKKVSPHLPVVMLTADTTAATAVQALRGGAYNYIVKPPSDPDAVAAVLRAAAEHGRLARRARELEKWVAELKGLDTLVGSSRPMREVYSLVERVAPLDVSLLVLGESGTGKELVARAVHQRSARAEGPFVALNCAALPESLVDSELFGHARGAFTGAVGAREGAFQRASGGTLFLDEIGDIPPSVQLRLLRAIQERQVTPVGSDEPRPVDVRLIAATLVDLEQAIEDGRFRPDLYYRLNVVSIPLPPLRARRDDVGLLATHFIKKHAERLGRRPAPRLTGETLEVLAAYDWPGNVRELENAVQRALALAAGDTVELSAFPAHIVAGKGRQDLAAAGGAGGGWDGLLELPFAEARKLVQERFERDYVTSRLDETSGNISEAARRSQLDRSNFKRIMQRTGVDRPGSE